MTEPNAYNARVASRLDEVASILNSQGANPFRIAAYQHAAETVRGLEQPLDAIVAKQGINGIDNLPGIGRTLARLLFQFVRTGRLPMLERLRGTLDPLASLASVPGVGEKLATRLHEQLGIDTLEELEAAVYDGRLETVEGFGEKRIAGVRDSLAVRLGRLPRRSFESGRQPSVAELLDIDAEYRRKADAGALHMITPRRFNARREAWLPILHTSRQDRHYTALFSNTALAHQLNKTTDWVVIYFETDHAQRQFTVVTSQRGKLSGKRVVRGRESECVEFYAAPIENIQLERTATASGGRG